MQPKVADFDLFLSHNRQQKPWVRAFAKFLRELGLTVFFDEDSVQPGEDVVAALERGIEASRNLVLVISRAALRSKWVSFETALRLYEDPLSEKKPLIPILAEPVDWSEVRLSVRRLDAVDLTDPQRRESEFLHLLRALGVADSRMCVMETWPQATGIEELHLVDVNSVVAAGWTGEQLLEKLVSLDYQVINALSPQHEGVPEQWAPVFMDHPETWRLLSTDDRDIVGYWHFVPLFPEDYQRAVRGDLLDSEITSDKLPFLELPGSYDIYFVSVVILPKFRRPKAVGQLFDSLFRVIAELAESGVFIRKICANAYTPSGVALCRSLKMERVTLHRDRGEIFEARLPAIVTKLPFVSGSMLAEVYRSKFGVLPT